MGVAYIERADCLAYTGSFCTVCSERCPVPGAIELSQGTPTIRAERCTGCGVCAEVCPAPANAIVVMQLADRP
ncbi:MAG: 4Fe-4S binding protein [Phycisphaerales bacterium]|nr:4Fe-4S binding protein [Phycisphaerales bacterium]